MKAAWERDYTDYVGARLARWHRQAYLLVYDRDRAEDLVQQTCVNLYLHWRRARNADSMDAYVNGMLVKAFLSENRRGWARRVQLTETLPDRIAVAAGSVEDRTLLRAALLTVPPRQRLVLVLRFLCDQSVAEVAAAMGCSPGTVKSQCAHGLKALRLALGNMGVREERLDAGIL